MGDHLIKAQYLSNGQYRIVCTCEVRFSHPLPGAAYEAWLAHRTTDVAEPEAVTQ